ncbi:MAG: AAA family ATPase [Planctomycetes bacterium]|nr:AAA family ATPase [Planctomycetota bacterium]
MIRLLTNFDMDSRLVLSVVLAGQPRRCATCCDATSSRTSPGGCRTARPCAGSPAKRPTATSNTAARSPARSRYRSTPAASTHSSRSAEATCAPPTNSPARRSRSRTTRTTTCARQCTSSKHGSCCGRDLAPASGRPCRLSRVRASRAALAHRRTRARAAIGLIGGAPKCCKTWFGLDLAVSVATGTRALGHFETSTRGPASSTWPSDGLPCVRSRIDALCRHRGIDISALDLHVITAPVLRLDLRSDQERLAEAVERLRPRLLLLDPLVRLHRLDENSAAEISDCSATSATSSAASTPPWCSSTTPARSSARSPAGAARQQRSARDRRLQCLPRPPRQPHRPDHRTPRGQISRAADPRPGRRCRWQRHTSSRARRHRCGAAADPASRRTGPGPARRCRRPHDTHGATRASGHQQPTPRHRAQPARAHPSRVADRARLDDSCRELRTYHETCPAKRRQALLRSNLPRDSRVDGALMVHQGASGSPGCQGPLPFIHPDPPSDTGAMPRKPRGLGQRPSRGSPRPYDRSVP